MEVPLVTLARRREGLWGREMRVGEGSSVDQISGVA